MTTLDPPASLTDEGKEIWRDTLAQLLAAGTRARIDPNSLLSYVEAVRENRRATALLNSTDILINRDGRPVPNPMLQIQRDTAKTIAQFARQFHLNETNRTRDVTPPPNGRWCETHKRHECIGLNKDHDLCHKPNVYGLMHCERHAGINVKTSPARLLASQQRVNPIHGEPLDLTPAEMLLWRARDLGGEVMRLRDAIAGLDGTELVKTREIRDNDGRVREYRETELAVREAQLAAREKALHSACEAALRAGIEERMVRIAEAQAETFRRIMLASFADMGIPADDPRIAEVLPRRIRELTA